MLLLTSHSWKVTHLESEKSLKSFTGIMTFCNLETVFTSTSYHGHKVFHLNKLSNIFKYKLSYLQDLHTTINVVAVMPSSHLIGNLLVKIGNYHVNSDPRIQESYVTNTLHTLKTCQEKIMTLNLK